MLLRESLLFYFFILLVGGACLSPAAYGQSANRGTVTGRVTTESGEPLPGAQVVDPALQRGTTTGKDGRFRLEGLPTGTHTLEIRFVGYQTAVREVELGAGETVTLDVALKTRVLETEGITVTGTARARSTLRTPQDVDVLGADELQVQRSASLGDVLSENVAGVSSIKTGSQAGKPVLRGLSGNRIVLLKDGIAQEFYQFGVRHFPTTSTSEAERIEVVRGASSILYGSDALGGAINVLTKTVPTTEPGKTRVDGRAGTQYFSNNNERAGSLELAGARGRVGARMGIERRIGDNFTAPDALTFFETSRGGTYGDPKYTGEIPFTNFDQWSGYAQVGVEGRFGTVQLYGDYWANRHNFLLPAGGPKDRNPDTPPPVGLGQNLEHGNLIVKGTLIAGRYVLKPRLSVQRSVRQSGAPGTTLDDIRSDGGLDGFDYPLDLQTHIYTGRLEAAHPAVGALSGTLGAEVQHQDADTRGPAELQPSARTWSAGVFVFEELDLDSFTVSFGARVDRRTIEAAPNERTTDPGDLENVYTTLSGALGANVVLTDGVALATNLSSGFRAPSVFELYADGVHGGVAAFQRGDPNLDPERSYSADLSLRVRRDRVTGEVAGYVNYITNYIYLENTEDVQALPDGTTLPVFAADQTDAVIPGIEASVTVSPLPWLQLGGKAAFLGGSGEGLGAGDDEDGALPLLPADRVSGSLRFAPTGGDVFESPYLNVTVEHAFAKDAAGRFEPFSQFDGGFGPPFGTASTRAYTVVNAAVGGRARLGNVPLSIRIGVDNVFNAAYRDFLDTYKGYALSPGRDVEVKLSIPFSFAW